MNKMIEQYELKKNKKIENFKEKEGKEFFK